MQTNVTDLPKSKANSLLPAAQSLRAAIRRPTSLYTREALVQRKLVVLNDNLAYYGSTLPSTIKMRGFTTSVRNELPTGAYPLNNS